MITCGRIYVKAFVLFVRVLAIVVIAALFVEYVIVRSIVRAIVKVVRALRRKS